MSLKLWLEEDKDAALSLPCAHVASSAVVSRRFQSLSDLKHPPEVDPRIKKMFCFFLTQNVKTLGKRLEHV